ncbi:hypothetical protein pEaSNUABM21_00310 [Erwinia phage pEa_SNUABM_21]|nr:hypothetical protein pEaSNUABM21_00310 [Erwinia phage pEa_SNUABM_21]
MYRSFNPDMTGKFFVIEHSFKIQNIFWMGFKTIDGREIILPIPARDAQSGYRVGREAAFPVIRSNINTNADPDSDVLFEHTVGILHMRARRFETQIMTRTAVSYTGLLPDVRMAKEGERYVTPLNSFEGPLIPALSRRLTHFCEETPMLHSSFLETFSDEEWSKLKAAPVSINDWHSVSNSIREGKLKPTVNIPDFYLSTSKEDTTIPSDVIEYYAEANARGDI